MITERQARTAGMARWVFLAMLATPAAWGAPAMAEPLHEPGDPGPLQLFEYTLGGLEDAIGRAALSEADRTAVLGELVYDARRKWLDAFEGWPLEPDVPGAPEPDPLPNVLPPAIGAYVESVAESLQVPIDLPLLLSLATLSASVAGRVEVEVRPGWREGVAIYAAVELPPASRKSPAYEAMIAPLREYEEEVVRRATPRVLAAQDVVEVAEKKLERTKTLVVNGKAQPEEVEAARFALEEARTKIPPDGRILAGDITPEAIVLRMAAQGGRLAILEPEPGPLQLLSGRYSDQPRLDEIKKAWSGEALRVDRVGRAAVQVARPALTLGLCIQPGVLQGLQNSPAFRLEGVMGRFLWCRPPHGLGTRLTGRDVPPLDEASKESFVRIVRMLLQIETEKEEGNGTAIPHLLRMDPKALEILHNFEAEVESGLADGGIYSGIRDWAGKAVGQSIRLAALLELAGRAGENRELVTSPIGREAMAGGVQLTRALATHALAVLGGLGTDDETALLKYTLRKVRELPEGSTVRDLFEASKGRTGINSADTVRDLLNKLEGRGCVRVEEVTKEGPGRPSSPVIEIHPLFRKSIRTIRTIPPEQVSVGVSANSAKVASDE